MNHLYFDFIYLVGGLILIVGLMGKRSTIPWAIVCYRMAASLLIASGAIGLITFSCHADWIQAHPYALSYWQNMLKHVAMGILITLVFVARKIESNKTPAQS